MAVATNVYKEALLRETREELAKADTKASILLAASSIAFAALLEDPDKLLQDDARRLAWALALALAGICFVGAAVKPRLRATDVEAPTPHYFGDVEAYRPLPLRFWQRRQQVEAARARFAIELEAAASGSEYEERLTDQIWHLSHIAFRKYRLVSIGMWLYSAALVVGIIALVVEKEWL
jgi:hypothetical protein